jgi:hypothetical protein
MHSAKLHGELFQRGTNQLRQLLKQHSHRGADLTMLRDPATGKVTQLPDEIKIIAGSYSRGLLGGSQGEQGAAQGLHVDRPWAEYVMWEQTRGKWGAEATELVCSLASTSETKEIINRSKSNGAPGLDGVQSSAL